MRKMYNDEQTSLVLLPGPVMIHPRVYAAMNRPIYGHRTSEFRKIHEEILKKIKPVFGLKKGEVYLLTGSGSLGLEAGIFNFVKRDEPILSLVSGKFGERAAELSQLHSKKTKVVVADYGDPNTPEQLEDALTNFNPKLVTITHNETSTAILNPLEELTKIAHEHGALVMADMITSAGGDYVLMDKWGVDIGVSGSQKCFGLPPGLGIVAVREEVIEKMVPIEHDNVRFYSDLIRFRKGVNKSFDTPFTPAISLFYGLLESLTLMEEEGLENRIQRHRLVARGTREGLKAMGIKLFAKPGYESNTVTAGIVPENIEFSEMVKLLKYYGVTIAGGQGPLKGKIFRIGHMNLVGPRDILTVLGTLELVLSKLGYPVEKGAGVAAAIEIFKNA